MPLKANVDLPKKTYGPLQPTSSSSPPRHSSTHVRQQLEGVLQEQVTAAAAQFKSTAKAATDAAWVQIMQTMSRVAEDPSAENERTECEVVAIKARTDSAERTNEELTKSVAKLQQVVSMAEASNPSLDLDSIGNLNREPNIGALWRGAPQEFDVLAVRVALVDWFTACCIEVAQVAFNGTGPSKRCPLSFMGGELLAVPRARKLHMAFRIGKDWREFMFNMTGSAASLYVSAGKAPRMV